MAHATLTTADVMLRSDFQFALFIVAAAALGLLFIGIHNAWDSVTHIVSTRREEH